MINLRTLRYAALGYRIQLQRRIIGATVCRIWGHKWGAWHPINGKNLSKRVCQRGCGETQYQAALVGVTELIAKDINKAMRSFINAFKEIAHD